MDIDSLEYHLFFDEQFNGREISKYQIHYDKENSTNSFEGKQISYMQVIHHYYNLIVT